MRTVLKLLFKQEDILSTHLHLTIAHYHLHFAIHALHILIMRNLLRPTQGYIKLSCQRGNFLYENGFIN